MTFTTLTNRITSLNSVCLSFIHLKKKKIILKAAAEAKAKAPTAPKQVIYHLHLHPINFRPFTLLSQFMKDFYLTRLISREFFL